jgi:predicted dehydrogenase
MNTIPEGTPIRFALVGAGGIGLSHLEALSGVEGAQLGAIVESRAAAGDAVAEQKRVRCFHDYRDPELLSLVDAVIVCTPPNLHHTLAKHFLTAGKHVLCEKPITIHSADAEELARLAESERLLLMMASKFRYVDDIIKAKAILETGLLGSIVLFENSFCGKVSMRDRWNSKPDVAGGGVLIDNGTHAIDIARYLLGPLGEVQAQNGIAAQGLEVEDTARIQFRTRKGVIGMIDLSWSINKESEHYLSIFGSAGTLLVGWKGSRYKQDGNAQWVPFGSGYNKTLALRRQLENFCGVLRGRELPLITVADAIASVKAVESAYQSASKNHWLPVGGTQ